VDLTDDERELILAALFELQLTRSAFDGDPDAARIPFARISHDDILALVDKLDTALFGAYRDAWTDVKEPVRELCGRRDRRGLTRARPIGQSGAVVEVGAAGTRTGLARADAHKMRRRTCGSVALQMPAGPGPPWM
jgi:hypothetical protein